MVDAWAEYLSWCDRVDRDPYPADEVTLITYASTLEDEHAPIEAHRQVLVVLTTLEMVDLHGIDHQRLRRVVLGKGEPEH